MNQEFAQHDLEKKILFRIVIYSVIVINMYVSFIIIAAVFLGTKTSFADIIYPIILSALYASYFLFKKLKFNFNAIKVGVYTLFTFSVAGSFFQNNGLTAFAIIDLIDLFAVGIFIFSKKSRLIAASINLLLILSFIHLQLYHPEVIKYNLSFNEQFTFAFGIITRFTISYNVFTAVIDAYNAERDNILNKNLLIKEYSDEMTAQNEEITQLNEELAQTNEHLYNANDELSKKNISLQETLETLNETQLKLYQSEKMASLGVLTAGVAHEINNPLNYIMGGYAGLNKHFEDAPPLQPERISIFLNSIKTGVDRASSIVNSLNQFSRNNETQNEIVDIQSIVENCLIMLQNKIKNRIEVDKEVVNENLLVKGNAGKLHQAFINIINNSIQAIEENGRISIKYKIEKPNIEIEISDNGCGIKDENLKKITDPFYTTKAPGEGTGLGLSITYSIIHEHNGNLTFSSSLNKGTRVTISLPLVKC